MHSAIVYSMLDKIAEKASLAFYSQGYAVDQSGAMLCEPNVYIAVQQ